MKKIFFAGLFSIISTSVFATSCNNASVKGDYVHESEVLADTNWDPLGSIAKVHYDGSGNLTVDASVATWSGNVPAADTGTGTYSVSSDCILTSTTTMVGSARTITGIIYLDKLVKPASGPYVAYHGAVLAWDTVNAISYKGTITKMVGK